MRGEKTINDSFPIGHLWLMVGERIVSEEIQGNDIRREVGKKIASTGRRGKNSSGGDPGGG